jgi:hypothetical protein
MVVVALEALVMVMREIPDILAQELQVKETMVAILGTELTVRFTVVVEAAVLVESVATHRKLIN